MTVLGDVATLQSSLNEANNKLSTIEKNFDAKVIELKQVRIFDAYYCWVCVILLCLGELLSCYTFTVHFFVCRWTQFLKKLEKQRMH